MSNVKPTLRPVSTKVGRDAWAMIYRLIFEGEAQDRMAAACAYAGVPPGVLKMLIHLASDEPVSMRDIAAHFGVDASYLTALVDELVRSGLAERRPHPTDRRVKTVVLTPRGLDIQRHVHELMWEPPRCLEALTPAECRQLRDLLAKAVAADPMLVADAGVRHGPPSGRGTRLAGHGHSPPAVDTPRHDRG
jgi:DNA-binding MarR family transcriptional regulator